MIPGLQNAEFLKLGSIHRNLYINSPKRLNPDLSSKKDDLLFFAGQITGVEGYFESTCIGLMAAKFLDLKLKGKPPIELPQDTAIGALLYAITKEEKENFQPTNINFGLLPPLEKQVRDKAVKKQIMIKRAQAKFSEVFPN
jgi:methylenetetrahydrofolate--tRNA-(uracil-5-)-methyltransferase